MSATQDQQRSVGSRLPEKTRNDGRGIALPVVLLVALGILSTWPVLIHGAPDLSHDALDHARWALHFAQQFWHGDWFPRWLSGVNGGFGGPSGFFYPPLVSYVSSLFWPLAAGFDPHGWLLAGYAIVLGQILSGLTAYLWLLSIAEPGPALLGAVVYLLAPYHLAIDVYQRGATAELWVFVWFPLVLLAAQNLIARSRWWFPIAAVSYGLAVLSHPTVSLCFAAVPVAYVLVFSDRGQRIRATAMMIAALLLGVALSCFYLLPAALDQDKAYVEWQTTGHGDFQNEWLLQDRQQIAEMGQYAYDMVTRKPDQSSGDIVLKTRMVGVTLSTLAAIGALFLLIRRCGTAQRPRAIAMFYAAIAILSFFLMTEPSSFVWKLLPFLKYLQFPFRLNTLLVISVAVLATLSAPHLWRSRTRAITLFLLLILVAWLGVDIFSCTQVFSVWRKVDPDRMERIQQLVRTQIDYGTMWPKPGNVAALSNVTAFDSLAVAYPPHAAELKARSGGQISGTARVESWHPRLVVLNVDARQDTQFTLNHFYYAGWQARIEGTGTDFPVQPSPNGFLQVNIPKGTYNLVIELPADSAERFGAAISLIALGLLGGIAVRKWAQKSRAIPEVATV